jgi:hypothetical protein
MISLQINGTAMGTKMAPSYANIFMGKLEKLIIQSASHKPLSWFRFIDDVDMKWIESEENLNRFFDHANNVHPTMCFCMVVQCSRTMLDKLLSAGWYVMTNDTLLFALLSLYWMRSFRSIQLALLKQWLMLALL